MKNLFNNSVSKPLSEAEQALKTWGIKYKRKWDGSVFVPGDLDIKNKGLTKLPDLTAVIVGGSFYCSHNELTSLQGAPHSVGGTFYCSDNQLTSLKHAPQSVGRHFYCSNNQLASLEHAPQSVGGDFYCNHNQLTSLQGAPQSVSGTFSCSNNQLTSLQGAPQTVSGDFYCFNNQLTSLKRAPQSVGGNFRCSSNQLTSLESAPTTFKNLTSDFGEFGSWAAVPVSLRICPETCTVLQSNIKVSSPLRLKLRPK